MSEVGLADECPGPDAKWDYLKESLGGRKSWASGLEGSTTRFVDAPSRHKVVLQRGVKTEADYKGDSIVAENGGPWTMSLFVYGVLVHAWTAG
jgi:hypothetical protein